MRRSVSRMSATSGAEPTHILPAIANMRLYERRHGRSYWRCFCENRYPLAICLRIYGSTDVVALYLRRAGLKKGAQRAKRAHIALFVMEGLTKETSWPARVGPWRFRTARGGARHFLACAPAALRPVSLAIFQRL